MSFLVKSVLTRPILNAIRNPILTMNCLKTAIRSFSITPALNKKKCPKTKATCKMGTCPGKKKKKTGLNCPPKGKKKKGIKRPKGSAWDSPECNTLPCPNPYPKFDFLYPRKQFASKVMQTWVSCPKRRQVKKVICKYKTKKYPPLPKRDARACKPEKKTACALTGTTDLMKCQAQGGDLKCQRVRMPGCCPARIPPSCKIGRKRMKCKKRPCPWKSFSECKKPPSNKRRPTECGCIDVRPMCEIYMIAKKKGYIK